MGKSINIDFEILKKILDTLPNSIYLKNVNGKYAWVNRASIKQLEYKHLIFDSIIGKSDFDVFPKSSAQELVKNDAVVINNKKGISVEEDIILPDGTVITQLSFKEPLYGNDDNEIIGLLGYTIDITEQKRNEELRKNIEIIEEKLASANRAGKDLAHQLRTPLATIQGSVQQIGEYLPTLIDGYKAAKTADIPVKYIYPVQLKYLQVAIEYINDSIVFINVVIDMLLKKSGQIDFASTRCSISECIEWAIKTCTYFSNDQKIYFDKSNEFTFMGPKELVSHVFLNLINNALYFLAKAMKGDVNIKCGIADDYNVVVFRDTGAGMSEDTLKNVFKPFFTTEVNGNGLGLAFCKRILVSIGGDIKCHSITGEYTEFLLYFPKLKT